MISLVSKAFTKVFGSRNERLLKQYRRRVEQINAMEPQIRRLTDPQLCAKTAEFQRRSAEGERVAAMLPQIMAVTREVMDRAVGIRNIFNPEHPFDPQTLPESARPLYNQVLRKMEDLPPIEVLGQSEPVPPWM